MTVRRLWWLVAGIAAVAIATPLLALQAGRTTRSTVPTYTLRLNTVARYPAQDAVHANMHFPRRAVYFLTHTISAEQAAMIAKWDYAVLGMDNQYTNPESLRLIKQLNPNIRLALYFAANEANLKSFSAPLGSLHQLTLDQQSDFLKTPTGQPVVFWPGSWTYNLPNASTRAKLVSFLQTAPDYTLWDDVFMDNIWNDVSKAPWVRNGVDANRDGLADNRFQFSRLWVTSTLSLVHETRLALPGSVRMVGNIGGNNVAMQDLNGRMFEGFPNTLGTLWQYRRNYLDQTKWRQPVTTIVHAEGNEDEVSKVQRGLAFTLMGDGYFAFDHGPNASAVAGDTGWHDVLWWYDEAYASIGRALTKATPIGTSGILVREFETTVVFYNTTATTKKVNVVLRNGTKVVITVPGEQGYFLKK